MKASELRGKDQAALQKELNELLKAQFGLRMQIATQQLNELLKAQFGLRMQIATQQLNNTAQLKKVRRDIARVKTVMNQKDAK